MKNETGGNSTTKEIIEGAFGLVSTNPYSERKWELSPLETDQRIYTAEERELLKESATDKWFMIFDYSAMLDDNEIEIIALEKAFEALITTPKVVPRYDRSELLDNVLESLEENIKEHRQTYISNQSELHRVVLAFQKKTLEGEAKELEKNK